MSSSQAPATRSCGAAARRRFRILPAFDQPDHHERDEDQGGGMRMDRPTAITQPGSTKARPSSSLLVSSSSTWVRRSSSSCSAMGGRRTRGCGSLLRASNLILWDVRLFGRRVERDPAARLERHLDPGGHAASPVTSTRSATLGHVRRESHDNAGGIVERAGREREAPRRTAPGPPPSGAGRAARSPGPLRGRRGATARHPRRGRG